MKRNKVLLGLFVGLFAMIGGSVSAQTSTDGSRFYEIGPSNVAGQVSSIVVDRQDESHTTLYAGAASGGLFLKSDNEQTIRHLYGMLNNADSVKLSQQTDGWHHIPYINEAGVEEVIPISAMMQGPAMMGYEILIGTGNDANTVGSIYGRMSSLGKGLFLYNPQTGKIRQIPNTKPTDVFSSYSAVHALDYLVDDDVLYVYVATSAGLYRFTLEVGSNGQIDESQWSKAPEVVYYGMVDQLAISKASRVVYFASRSNLYMLADGTADEVIVGSTEENSHYGNLTNTNSEFGYNNRRLKLAVAQDDPSFLYVMVVDSTGFMENIYLTRNLQNWVKLATSSVRPFTTSSGFGGGYICIDPANPRHIYVAGSTIYGGTGYVDGNSYQWLKLSNNEYELNYGNYMQYVYGSYSYVHSGVHCITPVYREYDGEGVMFYYLATDGGVFVTSDFLNYQNLNNGLNTLEVNSIDVAPDGSIISGAVGNACQFIYSQSSHDGGPVNVTWYDDGSLGSLNHNANVIWSGNGGRVAASKFQQLKPQSRRNIYVSSEGGQYGRSFDNYFDFTDNQVWTIGGAFLTNQLLGGGPQIGMLYNWETDHDSIFNDSLTVVFDTMGYVMRRNSLGGYDSVQMMSSRFTFVEGDKVTIQSRANSDYPFEYVFKKNHSIKNPLRVKNPLQSRMLVIACDTGMPTHWGVYMTWRAPDFTKVWEYTPSGGVVPNATNMQWVCIYYTRTETKSERTLYPRTMTMSEDGRYVFVAVQDMSNNNSFIIRISGFENVDWSDSESEIKRNLAALVNGTQSMLKYDTIKYNGTAWLPRAVSSLAVYGDSLLVTYEGYVNSATSISNLGLVSGISSATNMTYKEIHYNGDTIPAFSAIFERRKGTNDLFVGTADGVMTRIGGAWKPYENIQGVAVTSIVQQTDTLPVRHHVAYNGIDRENYVYSKTKWPGAIYFGTYGRGIFMDMTYVTDSSNTVCNEEDYLGIPTVTDRGLNQLSIYPNPVSGNANLHINTVVSGNAQLRVYDINGRCVVVDNLGYANEGEQTYRLNTENLSRGMYLVNVIIGGHTAAAKMMVR